MARIKNKIGPETVVILDAPLAPQSWDGEEVRDWNNPIRTTVRGCSVQPFPLAERLSYEDPIDREFARSSIRIYAPPGTKVTPDSRVEWRGTTYEVFGFPGVWHDLKGREDHVAFVARQEKG